METLHALLAHPVIPRFGWSLVHFVWQAAVLAAILALALHLLKRRSPNSRYLACAGAMLLMAMAVPVTMRFVPGPPADIQAKASLPTEIVAPIALESGEVPESAEVSEPVLLTETSPMRAAEASSPSPAVASPPWPARTLDWLNRVMPWAVLGWFSGVIILSARLAAGWVVVQRLKRRYVEPAAEEWARVVERLGKRLAVSRPVRIVRSSLAQVPSTIGWLRPVILLPAGALTGLSREQLEAIIAHELAHIRRHDYLVNLLQSVVETLLFYHPAVWWVSHRMRIEREHCCDDLAVAACGNPLTYARALSDMESLRRAPALLAAASGGSLVHRVRRILGVTSPAATPLSRYAAGLLVAMVVIAFAVVVEVSSTRALADESPAASPPPTTAPAAEPAEMGDQPHRWRHFVRIVVSKDAMTFEGKLTNWDHIGEGYGGAGYAGMGGFIGSMGEPSPEQKKLTVLELARASDDVPVNVYAQAEAKASEFVKKNGYEYLSDIGVHPLGSTGGKSQFLPPLTQRGRWRHFLRIVAGTGIVDGERAGLCGGTMGMGMGTDIIAGIAKRLPEPQWTMVEVAVAPNTLDPESYAQVKEQWRNEVKKTGLEGMVDVGVQPVEAKASPSVFIPDPNQAGYWRHYVTLVVGPDRMTFQGEPVTLEQLRGELEAVPHKSDTVLCIAVTSEKMDEQKIRERIDPALPGVAFNHISWIGVHPLGTKGGAAIFTPTSDSGRITPKTASGPAETETDAERQARLESLSKEVHLYRQELEDKEARLGPSHREVATLRAYVEQLEVLRHKLEKQKSQEGAGAKPRAARPPTAPASTQASGTSGKSGVTATRTEDRLQLSFSGTMLEDARNDKLANAFRPLLEGKPSLKFDTPKSKAVVLPAQVSTGAGAYRGKVVHLPQKNIFYLWATPTGKEEYHFYGPFPADALKAIDGGKAGQSPSEKKLPPRGKVQSRAGEPIAGARVVLYYNQSRWGFENSVVEEVKSAADGTFAFVKPMAFSKTMPHAYAQDQYVFIATHPDHAFGWVNVNPDKLADSYAITLTEPKTETVRVTDIEGKPLKGVWVWPYSAGSKESPDPLFRDSMSVGDSPEQVIGAFTDERGEAVLKGMPRTSVSYHARLAGHADGLAFNAGQTIKLCKGGSATGRVLDEDGKPVAGAVVCLSAAWSYNYYAFTRTDAEGRYRIVDQPADGWDMRAWGSQPGDGRYKVTIKHDDFVAPTYDLTLLPGETIDPFDIDVGRGTLVVCRVVEAETGKPVAGARLYGHSTEIDRIDGYSDAEGIFKVRVLGGDTMLQFSSPPNGVYTLADRNPQSLRFEAKGERMDVELVAPPIAGVLTTLRGRIVGPDGKPVAKAKVRTAAGDYRTATTSGSTSRTTTDDEGRFELSDIPAGRDVVVYGETKDRTLVGYGVFELPADPAQIRPLEFKLIETRPIQVTILDPRTEEPVKNTKLQIWPVIHGYQLWLAEYGPKTDTQGKLELRGILPGVAYSLRDAIYDSTNFQPDPSNMPYAETRVLIESSPAKASTQTSAGMEETRGERIEELLGLLKSPDETVRKQAVRELGEMKDNRAVPGLVAALKDEDSTVRSRASLALIQMPDPRAVESLIDRLQHDEDSRVRGNAAAALGKLPGEGMAKALVPALQDDDADVRKGAAQSLRALDWRPADKSQQIRSAIALGELDRAAEIAPKIQVSPDRQRAEGRLEYDLPVVVRLHAVAGKDIAADVDWIEFSRSQGRVSARLAVSYPSGPKAKWRGLMRLLDDAGKTVGEEGALIENDGTIIGIAKRVQQTFRVEFGADQDMSAARRFQIMLAEAKDESPLEKADLDPPAVLQGTVRDPAGKPLAGVKIHAYTGLATWFPLHPKSEFQTDEQGRYRVEIRNGAGGYNEAARRWDLAIGIRLEHPGYQAVGPDFWTGDIPGIPGRATIHDFEMKPQKDKL